MEPGAIHQASGTELMYWGFAVFGTLFFFLRIAAMALGGFGSEDFDDGGHADADVDFDDGADGEAIEAELVEDGEHHGHASDAAFKLLSVHTATGFCMMFGWMGLAAYKQFGLGAPLSFLTALGAGFLTMYATAWLFKLASHMTSPGASFSAKDLVGKEATVYLRIPDNGRGKIQIGVEGITRFIEAVSDDGAEIDSFQVVQVTRAMDASTVAVRRKD
ncbi:MAG: hypothetical protein CO113_09890 [Elusimicrobia bacterium CG_4_9_14_3_um_filter_62_55]|nr:MAG: hypothetical protein COR54_19000 [Elusimicrobia bacterium CG22_combo_CG10-13_8_21_14_all_63_91]PJA15481.1 MAG: hypothetical protein COX66_09985 [Elusimicrobia bacterium CG_4_10_14_0_2_um_filter_63_34]PJB25179.1 MAG: hypothetical protein CO113_09890 [Elusimicrobia bacterium CG_4_9_14_3_um_filter_62_55]